MDQYLKNRPQYAESKPRRKQRPMSLKPAQKDRLVTRPLHAPRDYRKSPRLNPGILSDMTSLSCKTGVFGVDPTRLELVTSAMRGRRSPD
jgi:hypothetical protein